MSGQPTPESGKEVLERTQRNQRRAQQRRLESRLRHYETITLTQSSSIETNLDVYPPLLETCDTVPTPDSGYVHLSGATPQTPQSTVDTAGSPSRTPTTASPTRPISGSWRIVVREDSELVFIRHLPGRCQEWLTVSERSTGEWEIFHTQETPDPLQLEFPS